MHRLIPLALLAAAAACTTGPTELRPVTSTPPLSNVFATLPQTLVATSFGRSDTLPLTIRNARGEQIGLSWCTSVLERRLPTGWFVASPPPGPNVACAAPLQVLDPGASAPKRWPLSTWTITAAGHYRVRFPDVYPLVFVPVRDSSGVLTDEFDVR